MYNSGTDFNIANNTNFVTLSLTSSGWSYPSDSRLKTNIIPIENSMEKISKLKGYYYNLLSNPNKKKVGVIAQEVIEVLPEAVEINQSNYLGVNYTDLIPLLINGMQDLQNEINVLKNEIQILKKNN